MRLNRYGWSWCKFLAYEELWGDKQPTEAIEFAIDFRQWHILGFNCYIGKKDGLHCWNIFFLCFRCGWWKAFH